MTTWLRLRSRQWARSIAIGALAALPATGAGAELPVDDAELLPFVGEAVVVGDRPRRVVREDPTGSATIVSADTYAGEAMGVADLAATAPGVAVNEYGGLGQLATASIRGSTANGVLVLLDGLPLDTAFGGGVDLASIPRAWIDRIEIVRGPEGAHYGQGSLGGVINVLTRRPRAGRWAAELTGSSFDGLAAAGDGALALGKATLFLSAAADRTGGAFPYDFQPTPTSPGPTIDSTRRNNAAWRAGSMAKLGAPVGSAWLDAVAQLSTGKRELPGWPYALTPGSWQADGRGILAARLSGEGPLPGLQLAARMALRGEWLDAKLGPSLTSQQMGSLGLAGDGRLAHPGGEARLGLEARGELAAASGFTGKRERGDLAASLSEDLLVAGERLRIAPAVRIERAGSFWGLSGKAGASCRIAGPVSLRASGGRTFRAPTEAELFLEAGLIQPNPALLPEEGLGGDAAIVVDAGPVYASVGGHATLYRDLIYYQLVSFGRLRPFNAGKVLVRGLELELAVPPIRRLLGLSASASYTLLETGILRGVEGVVGNELPHRARHRLYARLALAPGPLSLHAEAHFVGAQWADDRNLAPIPAATVWNAGGGVRLWRQPDVRLALELRNLLDVRSLLDGFGNPLPGRSVLVTLRAGSTDAQGSP